MCSFVIYAKMAPRSELIHDKQDIVNGTMLLRLQHQAWQCVQCEINSSMKIVADQVVTVENQSKPPSEMLIRGVGPWHFLQSTNYIMSILGLFKSGNMFALRRESVSTGRVKAASKQFDYLSQSLIPC